MIQFRNIPTVARKTGFLSRGGLFRSTTAVTMLAALGLAGVAQAQQWTGNVDSDYGTAGNWNGPPGVVPGDGNANPASVGAVVNDVADVAAGDSFSPGALAVEANATVNIDGSLTTTTDISGAATVNVDGDGLDDGAGNDQLVGDVAVRQDGTLQVNEFGTVDGSVDAGGTTVTVGIADGGEVTGDVDLNKGNLTVDGSIGGDLTTVGQPGANIVTVGATGSVGGRTTLESAGFTSAGILSGGITANTGTTASVTGGSIGSTGGNAITVNGGALTVGAGVTAAGDAVLNGSQAAGELTNNGTIDGNVTANNGVFTTTDEVTGNVTQNGGGVVNAQGTIDGDVTVNSGDFNATGALGGIDNVTNNARFNVVGGPVTVAGTVANTGTIAVDDGQSFNFGTMNNSSVIGLGSGSAGSSSVTLGGGVTGSAGSTFDMQNGAAGDEMTVQGNVEGTNTLSIDVNLTTTNGGTADVLNVDGVLEDGAGQGLTVDVDSIQGPLGYTLQSQGITIATAGTLESADLTTALAGDLPTGPSGLILYRLATDDGNNDEVQLFGNLNPALGSVAASLSSVQSLVTTTVNRPSGAYVSGIAFDTPGNCSTGNWARVTGGRAETESTSTNAVGNSLSSSGELDYGGIQGGIDYGCFEAFDGGWDVSGGLLIGTNLGHFSEEASGLITTGEFDQYFFGGYVAASTGNWSGELQLRHANSNYTFDNPDLDIRDADVSTDSNSVSGSLTYRYDLDNNGLALLPTVGFNVTRTSTSTLQFENTAGRNVGEMEFEDHTSKTGFVGTTLSRTNVNAAARSATNTFVTATYYMDGSGSRDSTFSTSDGLATESLTTDELGDFGELSVGGSYVRVLSDTPGQVRQVNYSVRADYRFGDDVSGAGITGQMRLQF
jgi:hypothetical protein